MSRFICSIKKSTLTQHYLTSDRAAMSSTLCNCADHVEKFTHQISVMRKELKNLRQQVDGAIRAHRKQMSSLESVLNSVEQEKEVNVNKTAPKSTKPANVSLEQGHIQTVPIGYINSCFGAKNGTPRQPTVCSLSRASLKIEQSVFNNPDHPLVGLEHYSHVWIIFLFHKNGHMSYKAKVKPPRLNGQRVGVYSTRSPHRPNALGLTLAKLERVEGDTLYLSEVDMISGTPVLDIKPYIPDYDSPHARADQGGDDSVLPSSEVFDTVYRQPDNKTKAETKAVGEIREADPEPDPTQILKEPVCSLPNSENDITNPDSASEGSVLDCERRDLLAEVTQYLHQGEPFTQQVVEEKASRSSEPAGSDTQRDRDTKLCYGEEAYSTIASWIRDPPVSTLDVRFTPTAEQELSEFGPPESTDPGKPRFQFLRGPEEAAAAIRGVLSADPRSVYRRTRCRDRLFFFSLDTADVACWFGEGFAEVVRVRPTSLS